MKHADFKRNRLDIKKRKGCKAQNAGQPHVTLRLSRKPGMDDTPFSRREVGIGIETDRRERCPMPIDTDPHGGRGI